MLREDLMTSCNPINKNITESIKTILTNEDMDDLQQEQAIANVINQCQMAEMITELKKLNIYMALITDQRI